MNKTNEGILYVFRESFGRYDGKIASEETAKAKPLIVRCCLNIITYTLIFCNRIIVLTNEKYCDKILICMANRVLMTYGGRENA